MVAKSQLKKMTKLWAQEVRKAAEKEKRDAEAAEATRKRAEEAKKIVITEDKSLSPAVKIKINQGTEHREKRIKVRKRVLPKCLAPGNQAESQTCLFDSYYLYCSIGLWLGA